MAVSRVSDTLEIQSHRGPYVVRFETGPVEEIVPRVLAGTAHVLVDANVARLYSDALAPILARPTTILIEATEANKSIEATIPIFQQLVANRIRRDHRMVAIGGGIVQDICCFIASVLLRGVPWTFVPTTLLAQADSCIGSKSSINLGDTKNIIGTFNPPVEIFVYDRFLDTLDTKELRSGIGEILKVHAIDGPSSFDRLAGDFSELLTDRAVLRRYIRAALEIKQRYIEIDEFDRDVRNIFNYGHSFGHAIESATHYAIPHGIAVSIGMDMANSVAAERGLVPVEHARRMHDTLHRNYAAFADAPIPLEPLFDALMKDKKNTSTMLGLILPIGDSAAIQRVQVAPDDAFRAQCKAFLADGRR